jgi:hypothetical protein
MILSQVDFNWKVQMYNAAKLLLYSKKIEAIYTNTLGYNSLILHSKKPIVVNCIAIRYFWEED